MGKNSVPSLNSGFKTDIGMPVNVAILLFNFYVGKNKKTDCFSKKPASFFINFFSVFLLATRINCRQF